MPLHCTIRENRTAPRHWNARSAARVVCSALEHGATIAEIEQRVRECRALGRGRPQTAAAAMAVAQVALENTDTIFSDELTLLARVLAVLGVLVVIGRIIQLVPNPASRLVLLGSVALRAAAQQRVSQIRVQRAANDAAIVLLRQAASNEANFLRAVGQ